MFRFRLFRGSKSSALESKRRLAILRKDVSRIVKYLTENAKSYHLTLVEICRLKIRFNAKNVFEFEPSLWNGKVAYIKNKEKIYIPRLLGASTEDFEDQILYLLAIMASSLDFEIGYRYQYYIIQDRMIDCIMNMAKPPSLCIIRPIFAARCIQRWWRQCITNPEYKICRKRLFQEWIDLTSRP